MFTTRYRHHSRRANHPARPGHRLGLVLALALLVLSSVGASMAGLGDAWAQEEPKPTEDPGSMDDKPTEEQKPDAVPTEQPKATEKGTEVPTQVDDKPVETEAVATQPPPVYEGQDSAEFDIPGIAPTERYPNTPDADATEPLQGQDSAEFDIPGIAPTTEPDPNTPEDPAQVDPAETGSVHIVKYICPEGYDDSGAGFATLEEECRADAVLAEFTVSSVLGPYTDTKSATLTLPPFMQEAKFDNVPATQIHITETILPGFGQPHVYCAVGASTVAEWIPQPVTNGNTVSWELEAESHLTCYFFNVQTGNGEEPDPKDGTMEPDPKGGTVHVLQYTCGPGIVPNEQWFRLYDQCHDNPGPVEITVSGDDGYRVSVFSDLTIPRAAEFTGVPFGMIEISEAIPAGYGDPIAFCADDGTVAPPVPVEGNTIVWELRADVPDRLFCHVFNFPEGDEKIDPDAGVVRITKFTCAASISRGEFKTPLEYMRACRVDDDPVEFSVTGDAGYHESRFTTSYNDSNPEEVQFTGIPLGNIEISESVPAGYGEPLAFCTDTELAPDNTRVFTPMTVEGGTIAWDLQTTTMPVLRCIFLNFEEGKAGMGNGYEWVQDNRQAAMAPGFGDERRVARARRSPKSA